MCGPMQLIPGIVQGSPIYVCFFIKHTHAEIGLCLRIQAVCCVRDAENLSMGNEEMDVLRGSTG